MYYVFDQKICLGMFIGFNGKIIISHASLSLSSHEVCNNMLEEPIELA